MTWREQAACNPDQNALFFVTEEINPGRKHNYTAARKICAACPVRAECLDYVMEDERERGLGKGSRYGMFGGLTPHQRWTLATQKPAA